MRHVFISYSRADGEELRVAVQRSLRRAGITAFVDVDRLRTGEEFQERLMEAIARTHVFVLLLTPKAAASRFVRDEFEQAVERRVPIVPVIRNFHLARSMVWNPLVGPRHFLDDEDQPTLIRKIRKAVQDHLKAGVVAFFNMKGGVGKTTLAAHFAARAAVGFEPRKSMNVLLIDLDPQQSLSEMFMHPDKLKARQDQHGSVVGLCEPTKIGKSRKDIFAMPVTATSPDAPPDVGSVPYSLQVGSHGGLKFDIVPCDFETIRYVEEVGDAWKNLVGNFKKALDLLRSRYDLIVMDCNPSVSPLTYCALEADHILVPITADDFGRRGAIWVQKFVERHFGKEHRPISVVFNKFYKTKKPRNQDDLIDKVEEGDEEAYPGAAWISPRLVPTKVPHSPNLVWDPEALSPDGITAAEFVNRVRNPPAELTKFVEELLKRIFNNPRSES